MQKMKAAICTKYGPPEVLKIVERDRPIPKHDEVLIKVYAASVTNSDIFIRSSAIPLRLRIPMRIMIGINRPGNDILGEVLSGEIVEVGSRTRRFRVGFLLMWISLWNLNVLPGGLLLFAVPLSMVEVFAGAYICQRMSIGKQEDTAPPASAAEGMRMVQTYANPRQGLVHDLLRRVHASLYAAPRLRTNPPCSGVSRRGNR